MRQLANSNPPTGKLEIHQLANQKCANWQSRNPPTGKAEIRQRAN
jgi:hypothetical protein